MYIGQGLLDRRGHGNRSDLCRSNGNQAKIAERITCGKGLYVRIVNESNQFDLLDRAKEYLSIMVYNFSNLWNEIEPSIQIPTEMIERSDAGARRLFEAFSSYGIYSLYQNYLYFISEYGPKSAIPGNKQIKLIYLFILNFFFIFCFCLQARYIKDENIRRQNAIQLTEDESKNILILKIVIWNLVIGSMI